MINVKSILEVAIDYQQKGFSVIPCGKDKRPLIPWKAYQKRRASIEEIKEWHRRFPDMNIGIVTGAISGIVVVDVEKDGDMDGYPPTVTAKSGGGGKHFVYKHPGYEVSNRTRIKELTDVRGDAGFIVASPSISEKGSYEWIVSPDESDFAEMPLWIGEKTASSIDTEKKWLKGKDGVSEGSRTDTAASMAGKIISSTAPELIDSIGWSNFKAWNTSNTPPLLDSELKNVWDSIKKLNGEEQLTKGSQADLLLKKILSREDVVLFHDENKNAHIALEMDGHQEILSCKSKVIKKWLSHEIYKTQKKAPSAEVIRSILAVLEGKGCFDGNEIKLENRVTWHKGDLWYDLTNKTWQAVKINKDGWEVIDKPPIIFKRYSHNKAQITPVNGGDINKFLDYINIKNPEHKLLFLVFLVASFISDFPHVMLVVFGSQGSSKSTLSRLSRMLVDPSQIEIASMPHNIKELIQALAHHYFLFFDNVSYISEKESDTLCKAITGGGHTKRELYQDDEDVIYTFMRSIGMNGINLVATRPDLLERSLLLELERIETTDRKTEKELYEAFAKDLPAILGGIFDVIVKAMAIHSTIKIDSHPRMADWNIWGCAIAQAIGYSQNEFLSAYENNVVRQTEMLLNENIVATALMVFMEDKDEWKDTPTQLLIDLSNEASLAQINIREQYWPKGANILSRRLNELSTPLKKMGLSVVTSTSGIERSIEIKKIKKLSLENNQIQTDIAVDGVQNQADLF